METIEAIRSRRTARRFSEREVSDELLEVLLDAGLRAPSNDHLRKWEFVVVRDRDRRLELVDRVSRDRSAEEARSIVEGSGMSDEEQKRMYVDAIPLQRRMLVSSSVLVLPFYYQPRDVLGPRELSDLNYFASAWCVIENVLVAAASRGVQGVTRIPTEEERAYVKKAVGAPGDYDFPCYLSLGYPSEEVSAFRQVAVDVRERVHVNAW